MNRTLAILIAVAMLAPATFAEDQHQNPNPANQPEQQQGTMIGTGMMMQGVQPVTIDTPVNPAPAAPPSVNGLEIDATTPLEGLFDLGLTAKQIEKEIDIRAELWKQQLPLVQKLMKDKEDLAVLQRSTPQDYNRVKEIRFDIVGVETDLNKLNDTAVANAMKLLTDDQKVALGDRSLPLFMKTGLPAMYGGHAHWGMQAGMMHGAKAGVQSDPKNTGAK